MSTSVPDAAVRTIGRVELPVAGTWRIDPEHADVSFVGRHFMITKVRGRFTDVRGEVRVAEDPSDSELEVVIGMASVNSGSAVRDEHLRSAELFDVASHPEATFRSDSVDWDGVHGTVRGALTIHGVTRRVGLAVVFEGHARDPWGEDRAVFSARAHIDREEFGVGWNLPLESGKLLVSPQIDLVIEVETVLQRS
jgi:polyisoprenoid-binding protein YceI